MPFPIVKKNFQSEIAKTISHQMVFSYRERFAVADLSTTTRVFLPAERRSKYRMVSAKAIAIGGSAAGGTLYVNGTFSGVSVAIATFLPADLVQDTVINADKTPIAGGNFYWPADRGTPIGLTTSAAITGATHIDVIVEYSLE